MGKEIVICSAQRTAIGSFGGMYSDVGAPELGIAALKGAMAAANIEAKDLDEVIVGSILTAGLGQNLARQIAMGAGGPVELPSYTINKLCGSGLKSVVLGAQSILTGDASIVGVGGSENMTRTPYVVPSARYGARLGSSQMDDLIIKDALTDVFNDYHMGVTAENLADQWNISREEMDEFALKSQHKTQAAQEAGRFESEITTVLIPQRKKPSLEARTDEFPRLNATLEGLSVLRPAFKKDGRVTAGNASGINDGAAMLVLADRETAEKKGMPILASIVSWGSAGVDPSIMGYGPVPATKKALEKAGWTLQDIELAELNEAFAAQSIAVMRGMEKELGGINPEIVNVNGGAISLGHPVGASGARILVTLLHEMIRRDVHKGLATLCIGGGQGISLLVQR